MRWPPIAGSLVGLGVALAALLVLVGRRLPVAHVVARRARISAPPDAVWATVTNVAGYPAWRPSVGRVDVAPTADHTLAWAEVGRHGAVHYEGTVDAGACRFTTRITGRELPYGGSWQIDLAPCAATQRAGADTIATTSAPSTTIVTITERGEVYSPIFRAIARYVIGHSATIDGYLKDLGARFASGVVIEPTDAAAPVGAPHGT